MPPTALNAALGFLATEVASPPDDPAERASQAYALYVLSLAGKAPAGAVRVAAAKIEAEPTPLARAQIAASLARLGEANEARTMFDAVLAAPARKEWAADDGSALRDQFATAVLARESGVMADRLPSIQARLPGADLSPATLNTQEQAWAATAAYVLSRGGTKVSVVADGRTLGPAPRISLAVEHAVTLRNPGPDALPASLVVDGVPRAAPPAARAGMEVHRRFYAPDGTPLEPDKLAQNTVFVMVLDGRATDGQDHQASVMAGLPAGWEIAGRFQSGAIAGMDWLGTLSDIDAEAAGDDRYAVALRLNRGAPNFRLAVMLRTVTPGEYEYPGITLADMYRPAVFARQGTVRVSVMPPGTPSIVPPGTPSIVPPGTPSIVPPGTPSSMPPGTPSSVSPTTPPK